MPNTKIVYDIKQVADPGPQFVGTQYVPSPSARKPKELAELLGNRYQVIEPVALTRDDFKLSHNPKYVDDVMDLKTENGFGTISQSVVDSLPYTNGAMYTAAKAATVDSPVCALVSGFHHACYDGWKGRGYFCTFNGLTIASAKLLSEHMTKICIIDCDMHYGNGTDDILNLVPMNVTHLSFGRYFTDPSSAGEYLSWLRPGGRVDTILRNFKPDVILYQAGVDVHINDPYGGVLTDEQIYERDLLMFSLAKNIGIPLAWDLAGGYQFDESGSIQKVLDLHMLAFKAANVVYG